MTDQFEYSIKCIRKLHENEKLEMQKINELRNQEINMWRMRFLKEKGHHDFEKMKEKYGESYASFFPGFLYIPYDQFPKSEEELDAYWMKCLEWAKEIR